MRFCWYVLGIVFVFTACIPNKKIVYLQKDDVNKKDLPGDSVVRTYNLQVREYTIQPLDILTFRMESLTEEEYDFIAKLYPQNQNGNSGANPQTSGFLVDNNGEIEFPVVGKIKFAGLTVFQAQNKLQEVFKPFLKNPVARVRLLNFRFTVVGEVNQEKLVVSDNTRVTLMEAIGLAGGLTDLADRQNVKIVRQKGEKSEVFYVNLLDENMISSQYFYIQQNDIIVVPALRQRQFRKYWAENIALFLSTVSIVLITVSLFTD